MLSRSHTPPTSAADMLIVDAPYRRGELWDGRFVALEPSQGPLAFVAARLASILARLVEQRHLGWITGANQGFHVRRDPDRVLCSTVAFTSLARLPKIPAAGFIECAPDFTVEVVSPTDRWDAVLTKAGVWIGHGSDVVWVVDPQTRRVAILRPGAPLEIVEGDGLASTEPAVPGFSVSLADLFRDLPPRA